MSTEAKKNREKNLRQRYGISTEDYDRMLAAQEGKCAICDRYKLLLIDHCHNESRVRGLLCNGCNTGLGQFEENPEVLTKAITYLNTHKG